MLGSWFPASVIWIQRIKLRFSDMAANVCTHCIHLVGDILANEAGYKKRDHGKK